MARDVPEVAAATRGAPKDHRESASQGTRRRKQARADQRFLAIEDSIEALTQMQYKRNGSKLRGVGFAIK